MTTETNDTTILNSQDQIADASTRQLLATYNALSGKPPITRFSSRAAGEVQVANAILLGQDRAAHKGVPKGTDTTKVEPAPAEDAEAAAAAANVGLTAAKKAAKAPSGEKVIKPDGTVVEPPAKKAAKKADAAAKAVAAVVEAATKAKVEMPEDQSPEARLARMKNEHCPICDAEPSAQTAAGAEGTIAGDERNICHHCNTEYWNMASKKAGQVFSKKAIKAAKEKTEGALAAAVAASWSDPDVRAARSIKDKVRVGGVEYRSTRQAFKELGLPQGTVIKFRAELKAAKRATFKLDDGTKYIFTIVKGSAAEA